MSSFDNNPVYNPLCTSMIPIYTTKYHIMHINSTLQNLDDKPCTMSAADDPDLSAPKFPLRNADSRPKRRYSCGDEESTNLHPPKRIIKEGFVKAEPMPNFSPYATPACDEATEANLQRESSSFKRKFLVLKLMPIFSLTKQELDESEETGCLANAEIASRVDFDSDVTAQAQDQQAWLTANYESVHGQYHELVRLTAGLYAIQNDLANYLQTYGDFNVPDPLDSPDDSQPLPNQVPGSFVEGGWNNPLEIRDEDIEPEGDDFPIRNRDVLSVNSLGNSSSDTQKTI